METIQFGAVDDNFALVAPQPGGSGTKLHDEIYFRLQHALIVGELVPGQAFAMRSLAEQFGTSPIPVRDALKRLVAEGVLMMTAGRSVYVPIMDRNRFLEILRVRLMLEPDLALRSTDLITDQQIATMIEMDERMQASVDDDDPRTYLAMNYNFHFILYGATRSTVELPIVRSLWMQAGPFLNFLFRTHGTTRAKNHHAEIIRALRRRDAVAVADAVRADLSDAADVILSREQFLPAATPPGRKQNGGQSPDTQSGGGKTGKQN